MIKRQKASDVWKENTPFLGTGAKVGFKKAFPTISSIKVKVVESDSGIELGPRHYDEENVGEFINCSNEMCYNGGFQLGHIIREMVRTGTTQDQASKNCQGFEGSPKGRKRYRSCWHSFEVTVEIEYKADTNSD